MSAGPEEDTSKQMRRAHYEIGALWQRVRKLQRSHAARVYLGSSQSVANSTFEKVLVDSVTDDPHGLFDSANNQIDTDRSGWWLVALGVGFGGSSGGDRRIVSIAHNAVRVARANGTPPGTDTANIPLSDVVKVTAGDTFSVQSWQDSGGSLGLQAQERETWLSAAYLGSA